MPLLLEDLEQEESLWHVGDEEEDYEIVDGQRVEMKPMSVDSVRLANRLSHHINLWAMPRGIGESNVEVLIRLPLPVERNRKPDMVFVPFSVWPEDKPTPRGNAWSVLPAICVEVVSPGDGAEELAVKCSEYFRAGVKEVWVIQPLLRTLEMMRSDGGRTVLTHADILTSPDIIPGFELPLIKLPWDHADSPAA